jgi:hypothetical protein
LPEKAVWSAVWSVKDGNVENGEPQTPPEPKPSDTGTTFLGLGVVLAAFAIVGLLAYRIYPASRPSQSDPSFVDIIFANNLVVFAARMLLFSAAVVLAVTAFYIVYSMVKSMKAGQPLEQFGPLRVRAVQDLSEELETWQRWWAEANDENTELRERLERADVLVSDLLEENESLREELESRSEEKESDH